jgi:sortase A
MSRRARTAFSKLLILSGCALLVWAGAHYVRGITAQAAAPVDVPLPRVGATAVGSAVARLSIPKIGLEAAVFEGTSDAVLVKGPGHLPGTELPGVASGYNNCVIAGHRDSFFRRLGWIRRGDTVTMTAGGVGRDYRVARRRIVRPEEVSVVAATKLPQITLITCYPFDWVGPAPYRLVVEALPAAEAVPPRPGSFPTHPAAAASAR